jgi:hypothetical protein
LLHATGFENWNQKSTKKNINMSVRTTVQAAHILTPFGLRNTTADTDLWRLSVGRVVIFHRLLPQVHKCVMLLERFAIKEPPLAFLANS